jgi:hypothetical protein
LRLALEEVTGTPNPTMLGSADLTEDLKKIQVPTSFFIGELLERRVLYDLRREIR